jgi:hypothetical protein
MPRDEDKTQIGIRLPAGLLRRIDANRHGKTRAEYCRELIEAGLDAQQHGLGPTSEARDEQFDSLREDLSETRQSAIRAEHLSEEAVAILRGFRGDFGTLFVGVLTKLGQVVREEHKRRFARRKAERFVKRILYSRKSDQEDPS